MLKVLNYLLLGKLYNIFVQQILTHIRMVTLNSAQIQVLKDYSTELQVNYSQHEFVDLIHLDSLSFESRFGRIKTIFVHTLTCDNGAVFTFEVKTTLQYDKSSKYSILSVERRCLACVEAEDVEDFAAVEVEGPVYECPEADIVFRNRHSPVYFQKLLS